ncbi:MAG: chromate transporter [Clostridiales bacterium]|nr:chromate transporter [Clostridiales bacterium]
MGELLTICLEFFKTGLFALGGGLATLPFLSQMQQTYGWFSAEELANMIAVGESTPGPIGVNMATYVGYSASGVAGALTATLSLVLPSLIVVCLIAGVLDKFQKNRYVENAFSVIRPAVTGLIAVAGLTVVKIALFVDGQVAFAALDWKAVALFVVLSAAVMIPKLKKLHPVVFILAGAVMGVVLGM